MPKAAKANQKDLIREGQDARKGHCRDNLEWIISCLNNTNRDKDKIEDYENDHPTSWNKKRFYVLD